MILSRDLRVARPGAETAVDRVAAGADALAEASGFEGGNDLLADHFPGERVGDALFETVTHLDPHLPLRRRDEEEDSVVHALAADAPETAEAITVILDPLPFQRAHGG